MKSYIIVFFLALILAVCVSCEDDDDSPMRHFGDFDYRLLGTGPPMQALMDQIDSLQGVIAEQSTIIQCYVDSCGELGVTCWKP